jgi:hypothetical protein
MAATAFSKAAFSFFTRPGREAARGNRFFHTYIITNPPPFQLERSPKKKLRAAWTAFRSSKKWREGGEGVPPFPFGAAKANAEFNRAHLNIPFTGNQDVF